MHSILGLCLWNLCNKKSHKQNKPELNFTVIKSTSYLALAMLPTDTSKEAIPGCTGVDVTAAIVGRHSQKQYDHYKFSNH